MGYFDRKLRLQWIWFNLSPLRFNIQHGLPFITLKSVEKDCHDAPKGVKVWGK